MPPEMHSHKAKVAVPKLQKYLRHHWCRFQVRGSGVKPGSWDVGIATLGSDLGSPFFWWKSSIITNMFRLGDSNSQNLHKPSLLSHPPPGGDHLIFSFNLFFVGVQIVGVRDRPNSSYTGRNSLFCSPLQLHICTVAAAILIGLKHSMQQDNGWWLVETPICCRICYTI